MALGDISQTDLAYAAGVIDSDGCVTASRSKMVNGISFRIAVSMTNIQDQIPLWFKETFGGRISKTTVTRSGKKIFNSTYKWQLQCRKAADFLELIVPYLKLKKERSEAAIKLARLHRIKGANGHRIAGSGTYRAGNFAPLTEAETEQRTALALIIRIANRSSNFRVQFVEKPFEVTTNVVG